MADNTKIDWADDTWNPVTGCLHGCEYCYARGIAQRFAGGGYGKQAGMFIAKYKDEAFKPPYELSEPQLAKTKAGWYRKASYPFGFEPTFHRYRLDEPARKRRPRNIFVVSMGDLFGEWVPDDWIKAVLDVCEGALQHNYIFLSKNPSRYWGLEQLAMLPHEKNFWYGTTVTSNKDVNGRGYELYEALSGKANIFLSIEPIHEELNRLSLHNLRYVGWVIVGAETGNRKDKVVPERKWIEDILRACREHNVPVFMKHNLADVWGGELIQEYPEALRKEANNG